MNSGIYKKDTKHSCENVTLILSKAFFTSGTNVDRVITRWYILLHREITLRTVGERLVDITLNSSIKLRYRVTNET